MILASSVVAGVTVLLLCDKEIHETCKEATEKLPTIIRTDNTAINVTRSALHSSGDYLTDLKKLDHAGKFLEIPCNDNYSYKHVLAMQI